MRPAMASARLLIACFWVGSLWAIGYLAAPTIFATLSDRALAGTIAGSLFRTQAWVSLGCGLLLLCSSAILNQGSGQRPSGASIFRLTLAMLFCASVMHFGIHPWLASLRESGAVRPGAAADAGASFKVLHAVSSVIYLLESILGFALVLKCGKALQAVDSGDKA